MTQIKNSVPEWIEMVGILGNQIAFFEAGHQVKPDGQDPVVATLAWLRYLNHARDDLSARLADYRRYS